jgi:ketosteroid isomerase-like protein
VAPASSGDLVALVERYFAAVDGKDMDGVLACFVPDVVFTISTFDTVYRGRDTEVRGMFERLFGRYALIRHHDFDHVAAPPLRIASRFQVLNRSAAGQVWTKSNCNFFRLRDGLFDDVQVYMSGDNALA